jgi:RNA polymerase sigma-70 factor (ECF subfamily)
MNDRDRQLVRIYEALQRRRLPGHSPDAAADLAAEALLRVLEHPAPDGRLCPWAETILGHLYADEWRRRARAGRGLARLAADAGPPGDDPEAEALGRERLDALARVLADTPADLREALRLRFLEELPFETVAARTGVPPATARTRVHRGLVWLRARLAALHAWWPGAGGLSPAGGLSAAALALVLAVPGDRAGGPAPLDVVAPAASRAAVPRTGSAAPTPTPAPAAPAPARRPPPAPPRPSTGARVSATAVTAPAPAPAAWLDFEDDEVEGALQAPDGDPVTGQPNQPRPPSLIEIPSSFVPAIARSLEEL